jgi:hypothetical protein
VLSLVRVRRERPRARDEVIDLVGRVEVALRTCSRRLGDPVDSYLHVGTGFLQLSVDLSELRNYLGRAKTRAELERALEEVEIKIVRDYSSFFTIGGKLVIPGSSIKGNVRSRIELSFVPKDGTVRSCLVRATRQPVSPPPRGTQGWRHFRIWSKALSFAREGPCDYSEGEGGVCLVCDLFGTAGLQGLINFSDFVGVDVDRATLTYLDLPTGERLEVVPPGSTFLGCVEFRNLRPAELGLLLYGMGLRNSREGRPVLLGKHKYRRPGVVLGVVRYSVSSLELAELSKPLKVRDITVAPGGKVSGDPLDGLIEALISTAREEFEGELEDIDEVGELERIEASA